ncbi:MAG: hypothetical protein VW934_14080, partial [Alphaproteobacteria bacterium]
MNRQAGLRPVTSGERVLGIWLLIISAIFFSTAGVFSKGISAVIQQQAGATGGSITMSSAQDHGCRLYPRLPKILQRSQVQCELCQCGAKQMAETKGTRWMCHPLLPAQSAGSPPCY